MIAKTPVVSSVIVLSLAVGIGANTAVFSWIRTVAFNPLPGVRDNPRLAIIEQRNDSGIIQFASAAEWRDLRAQASSVFEDVLAHNVTTFTMAGTSQDTRLWGEFVSGNFFDVLGVHPAAGRLLHAGDDEPGQPDVTVISHRLWQTQFGGTNDVIGKTIRLNARPFSIVGVAPQDFRGAVSALGFDVWVPQASLWNQQDRRTRVFQLIGRLRAGVTFPQANTEVRRVLGQLAEAYPDSTRGMSADVIPLWRSRVGAQALVVPTLATLQAVTLLVLLIVCTNTANLLLAQATTRGRELAIRLSLGAGRVRVVRQLLAESLLLALLGAGFGTLLAFYGLDMINRIPKPLSMPIMLTARIDYAELVYSVGLASACAVLFGLIPALQATRRDTNHALKAGGPSAAPRSRRRFQQIFVSAEIALTLVIVIMAGLFLKSFRNARLLDPGFNPQHVLLGSLDLASRDYDQDRARQVSASLLARVRELPGVESAAVATWVPLELVPLQPVEFTLEGRASGNGTSDQTLWYDASAGYFETLQIELIEGHDFSDEISRSGELEAVVNAEFVRRYLTPGQTTIGRRLTIRGLDYRIVGVARDARYASLSETPQPLVYLAFSGRWRSRVALMVRTNAEPASGFAAIKQAIHEVAPDLTLFENRTLLQHLDEAMVLRRVPARVLALLGPLAVMLAAIGLYSVLAHAVAQRTHEIGVRMALGASTRGVVLLMVRQGMIAVSAGLTLGLIGAYSASVRLGNQLVQVRAGDPWLFSTLSLLLAGVALFACWLPARRAAKVDPIVALRAE